MFIGVPYPVRLPLTGDTNWPYGHLAYEATSDPSDHRPCFHMETVVSRSWRAEALFNLTRLSVTGPFTCLARGRAWQPYRTLVRRAFRFLLPSKIPYGARRPQGLWPVRTEDDVIELCSMNIINGNEEVDRAISNGKLHTLLCFHTRPIDVVVFHGSDREHSFSGWFPA